MLEVDFAIYAIFAFWCAAGAMIGTSIFLCFILRDIIDMEKRMEGLVRRLSTDLGKQTFISKDPCGGISVSKEIDLLHSGS